MSMIDVEAIRAEVLRKHNLALGRDDPIFATVTLHEMVLGAFLERAEAASLEHEKRAAGLMAQEVEVVKRSAESMIAGAAKYLAQEVQSASVAARKELIDEVTKALDRNSGIKRDVIREAVAQELKLMLYFVLPAAALVVLALVVVALK